MKTLLTAMTAVLTVITVSCGTNGSTQGRSSDDRGQSLIDQKDYNQAIFTLMAEVQQNPGNERARILLASALAAKHGIVMNKFMGFARVLIEYKNAPADGGAPGSFASMKALAWQMEIVIKAVQALPSFSTQTELNDIGYAIWLLNGVRLTPGGYYYRALLKLVLFKYNLDHTFLMQTNEACEVAPDDFKNWLENMNASLGDLITDISLGVKSPAEKTKLKQLQVQMSSISKGMAQSLTEEDPPPESVPLPKILRKLYPKCGE